MSKATELLVLNIFNLTFISSSCLDVIVCFHAGKIIVSSPNVTIRIDTRQPAVTVMPTEAIKRSVATNEKVGSPNLSGRA